MPKSKPKVQVIPIDLDRMCARPGAEPCLHCLLKAICVDYAKRGEKDPSDVVADVVTLLIELVACCPITAQRRGIVDAILSKFGEAVEEIHRKVAADQEQGWRQ